jgi:cell division transport system permease protein
MKYIGATDAFVNAPFFIEGITIGIIGSIIPLLVLAYLYQGIVSFVLNKFSVLSNILVFMPAGDVFRILVPVSIILGIGIGAIGSSFAVHKHANV